VNVVWHDHPGVKVISSAVEESHCVFDERTDPWIGKPSRSDSLVEVLFDSSPFLGRSGLTLTFLLPVA
jgi:hypothetical protein